MSRRSSTFLLMVFFVFLLVKYDPLTAQSLKPSSKGIVREANLPAGNKEEPIADPELSRQRWMEDLQQQQWEGQQYNRTASSLRSAVEREEEEQDLLYKGAYPEPEPSVNFHRREYPDYREETVVTPPVREEQSEQEHLYENAYPK